MTAIRMIRADVLKLGKKRSVVGWALALTAGIVLVFYLYSLLQHASDPAHHGPAGGLRHFSNAFSSLGLDFGTVASRLLLDTTALGALRKLVLDAALIQLQPGSHSDRAVAMSSAAATLIAAASHIF